MFEEIFKWVSALVGALFYLLLTKHIDNNKPLHWTLILNIFVCSVFAYAAGGAVSHFFSFEKELRELTIILSGVFGVMFIAILFEAVNRLRGKSLLQLLKHYKKLKQERRNGVQTREEK